MVSLISPVNHFDTMRARTDLTQVYDILPHSYIRIDAAVLLLHDSTLDLIRLFLPLVRQLFL